jgi:hypothetical protein
MVERDMLAIGFKELCTYLLRSDSQPKGAIIWKEGQNSQEHYPNTTSTRRKEMTHFLHTKFANFDHVGCFIHNKVFHIYCNSRILRSTSFLNLRMPQSKNNYTSVNFLSSLKFCFIFIGNFLKSGLEKHWEDYSGSFVRKGFLNKLVLVTSYCNIKHGGKWNIWPKIYVCIKKICVGTGMMVQSYNLNYLESENRRIMVWDWAG